MKGNVKGKRLRGEQQLRKNDQKRVSRLKKRLRPARVSGSKISITHTEGGRESVLA